MTREEKVQFASALPLSNTEMTVGFDTAAGGGYGSPLSRPVIHVQADVRDGLVSLMEAQEVYGVIMDPETLEADLPATQARRRALAQSE